MFFKSICNLIFFFTAVLVFAIEPIDWSKAEEVQTGVRHVRLETDTPRLMKINILRVDLTTPGLEFTATGRAPGWGEPMPDYPERIIRTKRQRTRVYMKEVRSSGKNMIVAVNASPWGPWVKPFNHKFAAPPGVHILDGEIISDDGTKRPTFVVYKDGTPAIVNGIPKEDYSRIKISVTGFSIVVKDGKVLYVDEQLHPRTLYGISADKRYVYLMTIDGRQPDWSLGAACSDGGKILVAAGASDVINMDGGGSSTLIYWDEKAGKMVSLCRHNKKGAERTVGNNVGIILNR
jgi:exopolysaccharide biosynthesis protein